MANQLFMLLVNSDILQWTCAISSEENEFQTGICCHHATTHYGGIFFFRKIYLLRYSNDHKILKFWFTPHRATDGRSSIFVE